MYVEKLVKILIDKGKTLSFLEGYTGGAMANEITNVKGGMGILKFSAIASLDEFQKKVGTTENINVSNAGNVNTISVVKNMSKVIADFSNTDYGIGIANPIENTDVFVVYASVYDREHDAYYTLSVDLAEGSIEDNKRRLVVSIVKLLLVLV